MIKIIAFFAMSLDHIYYFYFKDHLLFSIIGRLAFPLFAWGIAMGSKRTNNFNQYVIRLFILSIISQIPYWYLFNNDYLNVCFTLLFGLILTKVIDSKVKKSYILLVSGFMMVVADLLKFEYGIYGILTIIIFYKFHQKYVLIIILQTINTIVWIPIYGFNPIQIFSIIAIFIIFLFDKYDFRLNRNFQYLFYPVHLLLLLLVITFL